MASLVQSEAATGMGLTGKPAQDLRRCRRERPREQKLAGAALRRAPLVLLVAMLQLRAAAAAGADARNQTEAEEPCSKALGLNESFGPKDRSYQDLLACDEHHKRTCCEKNHTAKLLPHLAFFAQERSPRCAKMGQLALCSLCDGDVGVGGKSEGNVVSLCPSLCRRWFQACYSDFFAYAGSGEGLQPCGHATLVCSPLSEITQDAAEFCARIVVPLGATFKVGEAEEEPDHCFDGVPSAKSRGPAAKAPWTRPVRRAYADEWLLKFISEEWLQWLDQRLPQLDPYMVHRINQKVENHLPGIIVALVAMFFAWYVWSSRD